MENRADFFKVGGTSESVLYGCQESLGLLARFISRAILEDSFRGEVPAPVQELVSEGEPVFLYEDLETADRSIVRVKAELGQGRHLRGPIPTVRAVDENVRGVDMHVAHDEECSLQDRRNVSQPVGLAQGFAVN